MSKQNLTRGIDPIPPELESASAYAAVLDLKRAITTLTRLAKKMGASPSDQACLMRVRAACIRSLHHLTGSFDVDNLRPMVEKMSQAAAEADRNFRRHRESEVRHVD